MPAQAESQAAKAVNTKPDQSAAITEKADAKSEIEKLLPDRSHEMLDEKSAKPITSSSTVVSSPTKSVKKVPAPKKQTKSSIASKAAPVKPSSNVMPPTAPRVVRSNPSSSAHTNSSASSSAASHAEENPERIARPGQRPPLSTAADAMRSGTDNNDERIPRPTFPATAPSRNPGFAQSSGNAPTTSTTTTTSTGTSKVGDASKSGSATTGSAASTKSPTDLYPQIGKLEQLTFGTSKAELSIEDRLLALENAIFATSYPNDSLFDRTERLKITLLGKGAVDVVPPSTNLEPPSGYVENPLAGNQPSAADLQYFDEIIQNNENYEKAPKVVLDAFALELINFERERRALGRLDHNPLAQKLADEHTRDLIERNVVSHNNAKGENPDRRFTLIGGMDAVNENLSVLPMTELGTSKLCKAAVAKVLRQMFMSQDDREALLAPEASHLGFSIEKMNDGARVLACIEIMTARAEIHSLPKTARVGDKIEVSGVVQAPYQFDRISLAWEGVSDLPPQDESSDEALPYFPPLDFVAYKEKSEKDHAKAIFALKTVGMLAAIAGGMFVPPVALAAPLIMMAGPDPGEAKPISDVPVKGGVKVDGNSFNGKVSLSNDGKEGLYYVTVWGHITPDDKPVAISRRAILVKQVQDQEDVEGSVSIPKAEQKDSSNKSNLTTDNSNPRSGNSDGSGAKSDSSSAGDVATEQLLKSDDQNSKLTSEKIKPTSESTNSPTQSSSKSDSPTTDKSSTNTESSNSASENSRSKTDSSATGKSSSATDSAVTDKSSSNADTSSSTASATPSGSTTPSGLTESQAKMPTAVSPESSGWNEIKAKPPVDINGVSSGHAGDAKDEQPSKTDSND